MQLEFDEKEVLPLVKKKSVGRPFGGKSHPTLRKYWREQKRKQRAKEREA